MVAKLSGLPTESHAVPLMANVAAEALEADKRIRADRIPLTKRVIFFGLSYIDVVLFRMDMVGEKSYLKDAKNGIKLHFVFIILIF